MTDTATHLLGHGSCPACQDDGRRLIKELRHLRAVNAKLLEALEAMLQAAPQTIDNTLGHALFDANNLARDAIEEVNASHPA